MLHEQTTLTAGTLLRERYLIKEILGSGNAGAVYLASDKQIKRLTYNRLALKEFVGLDQQARLQFTFSGVRLRQLRHPALPTIQHIFNDDKRDRVYLTADFVDGSNFDVLRKVRPGEHFTWAELQALLEPLIDVLGYLHNQEQPLIHGDIKPTSLLQSRTGTIQLVGLGYVQAAPSELRQYMARQAVSAYRAPEYFTGEIREQSDIYALAATLYLLLTGTRPVDALTRQRQVSTQRPDPLPLANTLVPEIPSALARTLQQALALQQDERFSSVQAFWQALQASAHEAPPTPAPRAVSTSTPEPTSTPIPTPLPSAKVERAPTEPPQEKQPQRPRPVRFLQILLICIVLLLLLGTGIWLGGTGYHSGPAAALPPSPTATTGYTPTLNGYPQMLGTYTGILYPLAATSSTITFTLNVQGQHQNQISGTFVSTVQKESTFHGQIDFAGKIQFIVADKTGNAMLTFTGGSNDSSSYSNTLGGTFLSCAPNQGPTCQISSKGLSGTWTMVSQP